MTTYRVSIIHPTPAAEFTMSVRARSEAEALHIAFRRIADHYGPATMYTIGNIAAVAVAA